MPNVPHAASRVQDRTGEATIHRWEMDAYDGDNEDIDVEPFPDEVWIDKWEAMSTARRAEFIAERVQTCIELGERQRPTCPRLAREFLQAAQDLHKRYWGLLTVSPRYHMLCSRIVALHERLNTPSQPSVGLTPRVRSVWSAPERAEVRL